MTQKLDENALEAATDALFDYKTPPNLWGIEGTKDRARTAITAYLEALPSAPAAGNADTLEVVAKAIFGCHCFNPDKHPWIEGGNSFKQQDARRLALAALEAADKRVAELERRICVYVDDFPIEVQRAEAAEAANAAMRDALEPFARVVSSWPYVNNPETPDSAVCSAINFTVGNYRRASAALRDTPAEASGWRNCDCVLSCSEPGRECTCPPDTSPTGEGSDAAR